MEDKKREDIGLDNNYDYKQKRSINKEGSFNVKKIGAVKGVRDLYQHLVTMSWSKFLLIITSTYISLNLFFALCYYLIGIENLQGILKEGGIRDFFDCFYFSTQTFTTVGYGAIAPVGILANLIASIEAMVGLLSFALATGLLFGRFSKPNAKFLFSDNILVSPYKKDIKGLMFRVVNKRNNVMLETSVEVTLIYFTKDEKGQEKRSYKRLPLEIDNIRIFPSTWTIVHPIDKESPFYEMEKNKLDKFEIIVMMRAYDETFGQHVYARTSYLSNELIYKAKFNAPHTINAEGEILVNLHEFGNYHLVDEF